MGNIMTLLNDMQLQTELNFYSSVIVICAGGTINMSGTEQCKPSDGVGRALNKIADKLKNAGVSFISDEPLFDRPPDSSNVGEKEWEKIISRIDSIIKRKEKIHQYLLKEGIKLECGGLVVAHGTDTLHITSLVIALEMATRNLPFPIVFTASHSTLDASGSDAIGNLQKSIYVAKERFDCESNLPAGVYVLIGQDIHLASRLTKVFTLPNGEGKYFYSFPSPIGQVSSTNGGIYRFRVDNTFLNELVKSEKDNISDLRKTKPWGIVEHIYLDKFACINVIEDFKRRIAKYHSIRESDGRSIGLVIQGDFKNNHDIDEIAQELKIIEEKEGVIILVGSKQTYNCLKSKQVYKYLSLIPKSMSHQKAKIKLGWLLRNNISRERVVELMGKNIAGEVFSTDLLPEWINFETFPKSSEDTEIIIAYPDIHPCVLESALSRLTAAVGTNTKKSLYLYGFGDGHYPTANLSIAEMVKNFIYKLLGKQLQLNNGASLAEITSALITFVSNNRDSVIIYLNSKYALIPESLMAEKLKQYVYKEEVTKEKNKISSKVSSLFIDLNHDSSINISLPAANLKKITEFATDNIHIAIKENKITDVIEEFRKECSENSIRAIGALNFIANRYPEIIAQRLLKDAIMESHENMMLIGRATDNKIAVHLKTLAVRSKTDSMRYEIGNMLMALGADSDRTKGNKNLFFIPKA